MNSTGSGSISVKMQDFNFMTSFKHWFGENMVEFRAMNEDDIDSIIASSMAGVCATIAGHPMDSIKIRMAASDLMHQSVFRTMYNMIKKEGIMPFYRGVFPPTMVKACTTMIFFTTNQYLKDLLIIKKKKKFIENDEPLPDKVVLSLNETFCVAGLCGFILAVPISMGEFIKIQLQNDKNLPNAPRRYKNMLNCTRICVQYRTMTRGMMATSMRLIPGWGVYLYVYDGWNRYFDDKNVMGDNEPLSSWTNTMRVLAGATLAGWSSWTASYPFDYIKTRIQAHPITKWNYVHTVQTVAHPPRIRDVCAFTIEKFGFRGFYRGLLPCLIRSVPVNLANLWVYESVLQLRKKYREN